MSEEVDRQTFVKLRERVGLTQRQVAAALDVSVTTVSSWERGRKEPRLSFTQTKKLMELYQCSINELAESLDSFRQNN